MLLANNSVAELVTSRQNKFASRRNVLMLLVLRVVPGANPARAAPLSSL
jgi:hypothetical protein